MNVSAVTGLPEIEPGADLARLIADAAMLEDGDVVVVAQKVVSKADGRIVRLADVALALLSRAAPALNIFSPMSSRPSAHAHSRPAATPAGSR
jgi:F420-0:gamma-glutamyl ligase